MMPDLVVMGKIIGGGLPAAAYGGRRDLMEQIAPSGQVYQAGTLSGNPLATAAGLATLRLLDEPAYRRLDELAGALAGGLAEAAAEHGVPLQVAHTTGLLTPFFSERPGHELRGGARPATSTPTPPSAARCSRAACTRRRRSSRPGSPRWRTATSTWSAPWTRLETRSPRWRRGERARRGGGGRRAGAGRARGVRARARAIRRRGGGSRQVVRAGGRLRGLPPPLRDTARIRRHGR